MAAEPMIEANQADEEEIVIPDIIPILPLRNTVVFPQMAVPLSIGRAGSKQLVQEAANERVVIGLAAQKKADQDDPGFDGLYRVGTAARIVKLLRIPDGSLNIIIQGINRFRLIEPVSSSPYLKARIEVLEVKAPDDPEMEALFRNVKQQAMRMVELSPNIPQEAQIIIHNVDDPMLLIDMVVGNLNLPVPEKQGILEMLDMKQAMEAVLRVIGREGEVLEMSHRIQDEVKSSIDKTQREYFLRQQLKAIQKELGEEEKPKAELAELKERLEKAAMPPEVNKGAMKEFDRLSSMPEAAAEYSVIRTYLDWMAELPWSKSTRDKLDIGKARKVLDDDHHDLEKVKKRILEYLAVRKLARDPKGPILCFAGPPGVGKTSLGRSIARSLGRKFFRMSLGGIHDEAEIRGHRRTYVGALPGRIIQGIRKAESRNPVFMLDEVDKVGADFRGDPSSALLEVLDPEQNFSFADNYLGVPFDLSKVLFIATANSLHTIPPPLRDRMEVIDLPGYTEEEKLVIARKYLVPRQVEANGLRPKQIAIADEAIKHIIANYTREAGVRNLEREIAALCRGAAVAVAEGKRKSVKVERDDIQTYLGPERFVPEVAMRTSVPGVATGMAWTPAGGNIIFIEAARMHGRQKLILTGQLGDVMRESAQAALSYLKSQAKSLGIPAKSFDQMDIHVHVPSGAIPKDGPSAGVTIYTALASLFLGRTVHSDLAMTGEVTLRGLVLPVGGIKEKVLAAHRAGIRKVILPEQNRKDLEEIPETVRKELTFHFARNLDDVVSRALEKSKRTAKQKA